MDTRGEEKFGVRRRWLPRRRTWRRRPPWSAGGGAADGDAAKCESSGVDGTRASRVAVRSGGEVTDRVCAWLGAVCLVTVTPLGVLPCVGGLHDTRGVDAVESRLLSLNFLVRIGRGWCGAIAGTHGEVE